MIQSLLNLSRRTKQILMLLFDFGAVITSIFFAFSLRLGYFYYPTGDNNLLLIMIASPILALPIFASFGLYREVIRYVGFKALWHINQAATLYAILWALIVFMAVVDRIPRSVILINWILVVMSVGGMRFIARWLLLELNTGNVLLQKRKVLIYGAGSAGRELCTALYQSKDYKPVAFIDNATELYRQSINGLEVFNEDDIADLIEKHNIKEVLLAMPSITRIRRSEIISYLEPFSVVVRSLPSLTQIAKGKVSVNDLLEIDLRDLLGREPVKPNTQLLKTNITNKVVLVTGAGGSIGSELCRQIVSLKPKKLVLFDISEPSLYIINQELLNIGIPNVEIVPVIGSVRDRDRIEYIINYYVVKTIYHAAAYKHVPLVEFNPSQGILNNSIGTIVVAKAAISANVETFVLISTDKAVRPTNVMGASKRIAELVLQAFNKESHNTCFTMVRFGNVLDSSGSVIPLFKKQIRAGGPVTVTHFNVVRYFMTIPEAVELVIQAGAMAKGGEVFVLDMGEPIRIYDLAVKMIQLSGLVVLDENNPKGDIEIQYTGLRPGEKLYEELLVDGRFSMTKNKLIMRAEEEMIDWDQLEPMLMEIEEASKNVGECDDNDKLYQLIKELVPQFNPQANVSDNEDAITADTK
jgi:FlaA1/EpsC-like NDP-sugar epimerase